MVFRLFWPRWQRLSTPCLFQPAGAVTGVLTEAVAGKSVPAKRQCVSLRLSSGPPFRGEVGSATRKALRSDRTREHRSCLISKDDLEDWQPLSKRGGMARSFPGINLGSLLTCRRSQGVSWPATSGCRLNARSAPPRAWTYAVVGVQA
jgi:hypothetical protein